MTQLFGIFLLCLGLSSTAHSQVDDSLKFPEVDTPGYEIWEKEMNFDIDVLGYKFNKVVAYNVWKHPCVVGIDIHYTSPTASPIRMQVKVKFKSHMWVRTEIFGCERVGGNKFTYYFDTGDFGCWGLKEQLPMFMWIETCSTAYDCIPKLPGAEDEKGNTPNIRIIKQEDLEKEGIDPDQIKKKEGENK